MYNMIEEKEPVGFNTIDNYLYFDQSADSLMEQEIEDIQEVMDHLDLQNMNTQDFSKLLLNYDLSTKARQSYEAKFQKAKMIYKRDKAKTRNSASCLKLLQPLSVETSESVGVKVEADTSNNKQEEQKRRKRISAQMSRDKKKIYIQQIETENQALKRKCKELEAENNNLRNHQKPPVEKKRSSLKSWLIMSLILFSLQKEKEVSGIEPIQREQLLTNTHLFKNAQQIINEYDRQPIAKRLLDLEKVKHFTELNEEEQVLRRLKSFDLFPPSHPMEEGKPHPQAIPRTKPLKKQVKLQTL